jgi:glycosyltransferase involved in cell wall biosynthesis
MLAHATVNVACSAALAAELPRGTVVVANAYDDHVFRERSRARPGELIFVGRLVSDKGPGLLLEGLALLREQGVKPSLTIVGFGPEEAPLRAYCRDHGLLDQVSFAGARSGPEIAELLNAHRVLVVPSRVEPFGIVALEGIACGCVIVGADVGGLPEAVGECGTLFRAGDARHLADTIARALSDGQLRGRVAARKAAHLARFCRRAVAQRYLEIIRCAVGAGARR